MSINSAPTFRRGDGIVTTAIGLPFDTASSVALQPDGRIVAAGYIYNGNDYDFALSRYDANGALDTSFGGDGIVTTSRSFYDYGYAVALQQDGKIVVAGSTGDSLDTDLALLRYNADGTLDTGFGGDGVITMPIGLSYDEAHSVVLLADGKLLVGGYSSNGADPDFALVRFNADGTLDTNFGDNGVVTTEIDFYDVVRSLTVQPDGKILAAGSVYDGSQYDFGLVRYDADGSLDTGFGGGDGIVTTSVLSDDAAYSVVLQSDGKIVLAGLSRGVGGGFALVRYDDDGSLDTGFGGGDGIVTTPILGNDAARSVALQPDGKLLVAGYASGDPNNYDFALARYNVDGTLDTSFGGGDGIVTTSIGLQDYAYSLAVQPDGKIVVAGDTYDGSDKVFAVLRYNADGSLDLSFDSVNTLDETPSFTEGGTATVLDADVSVYDAELAAAGSYAGASLTLMRRGGADADDIFGATGTLSALIEGERLVVGGVRIGTVTQNSAGQLVLSFGTNATQERVDAAMRQITYANVSPSPEASVTIDWTFDDGNTGGQGTGGAQSVLGSTRVSITDRAPGDFNDDNISDLLWRNDDGTITTWQLDGPAAQQNVFVAGTTPDWTVQGAGDFDGDGRADLLFRNGTDGRVTTWQLDGATATPNVFVSELALDRRVDAIGDFNGDGRDDLLVRDANGAVSTWQMDGATASKDVLTARVGNDWRIVGSGDFNGDGKDDLVWRNSNDGTVTTWQMDGSTAAKNVLVARVATDWHLVGAGDFNGDGKDDLLWRNDDGTVTTWQLDGGVATQNAFVGSAGLDWEIAGTGDFNGDGTDDLLWRNMANGQVTTWEMHGPTATQNAFVSGAGLDWKLQPDPYDFV